MGRPSSERRVMPRSPFSPPVNRGPAIDHREDQGREGQREQREVDAAPAQGQEAHDEADHRGEERAEDYGHEHVPREVVDLQERRGIGRQAEEGAVAEGKETRIAQEEIEAQSHQGEDRDLGG